ncbi:glycosyltransferase [Gracilibacillus salitolerans]|uniref:Glycosyltransferase n=1 Tax=Gracilibacillus salitolerans TaxID=2663022 RepID=A0A5Q2TQ07_9BACI|nr:glycosyltransferase family 2 protein [Gracilibacillus salitolerans]QGH36261.1 glycosyltransferase [Gracilibacillus salitolerans]
MEQPLVSVVIPFYSGMHWLIEAINSVVKQTYKNIEILVINDGSSESMEEVKNIFGSSIIIINKKNGGPASARNLGIEKSSGKYIAFLDSDDIWDKDKLTIQISEMESNGYIWSQHSYEMFWENTNKTKSINTSIYSGNIFIDCFISLKIQTSCVVILRKILIDSNIRFPIEKRYGQDGAFYRYIARDNPIGYVNGVYTRFRVRGSNAGFRAKVQIDDRASIWNEIKKDKNLLTSLPVPIRFAYKASNFISKCLNNVSERFIKNTKYLEILSRLMYILPYTIYKIYAKKSYKSIPHKFL